MRPLGITELGTTRQTQLIRKMVFEEQISLSILYAYTRVGPVGDHVLDV